MRLKIERRRMQRHSKTFATIEERDRFLASSFPKLLADKRTGYFVTPEGNRVTVWNSRVVWSTPLQQP